MEKNKIPMLTTKKKIINVHFYFHKYDAIILNVRRMIADCEIYLKYSNSLGL